MRLEGWSGDADSDAHRRKAAGEHEHYSNDFYRLEIRELEGFPISTGLFFLKSCDQIMLLFVTAVIWSKWRRWFQRQGPFSICCALHDCGCSWSKGSEKRIGTGPTEQNGFILSTSFLFIFKRLRKWSDRRERNTLLGGCSLRSEET